MTATEKISGGRKSDHSLSQEKAEVTAIKKMHART